MEEEVKKTEIINSNEEAVEKSVEKQEETKPDEQINLTDIDSLRSRDSIDKEVGLISESAADQVKNSEESNYEDLEDSNSPFLVKQIREGEMVKNKENNQDDEYDDDEEDYDDDENDDEYDEEEDEFLEDEDDCDEQSKPEDVKLKNEQPNETETHKNETIQLTNESKEETVAKPDDSIQAQPPMQTKQAERRLSRQTSSNSITSGSTPVNPALAPVKKGQFFEHDDRDDEDDKKEENTEVKETSRKNSINNKKADSPNVKAAKNETSTSGSNENLDGGKWSHDLYEKHHDNKPREKKPNQFPREKRPRNRFEKNVKEDINKETSGSEPTSTFMSIRQRPESGSSFSNSSTQKPKHNRPQNKPRLNNTNTIENNSVKVEVSVEIVKQEEKVIANKSKGLSLSEYLEKNDNPPKQTNINETTDVKPKRKPNMQPYQPHQRFSNNENIKNRANLSFREKKQSSFDPEERNRPNTLTKPDLQKRLDFSTRKPIDSRNFENVDVENDFDTNRINRSNNNSLREDKNQKFNLKITTNLDNSRRVVQEEPIILTKKEQTASIPSFNQSRNNFNKKSQANRPNEISNQQNLQNVNLKNRNNYDEYYFPEDVLNENNAGSNSKPKKQFDRNRQDELKQTEFNRYPITEFNPQQINRTNKPKMNPMVFNSNEQASNYNDYSEYASFNNNEYNQQFSNNNNNNASFQVKSQSYSNSNYKTNQNRNYNEFNDRMYTNQGQEFQRNLKQPIQQYYPQNFNSNRQNNNMQQIQQFQQQQQQQTGPNWTHQYQQ